MYKKPDFFDVTRRGTFYIDIKPCDDITKLSDSFMTRETLELMNTDNSHWEYNTRVYMSAEIKETCKEWAELIPEGSFGTIRTTPRIKTMINEIRPDLLRRYMQVGFTVRGTRIINTSRRNEVHTEQARKEHKKALEAQKIKEALPYTRPDYITYKDVNSIRDAFSRLVFEEYSVGISYKPHYKSLALSYSFIKRLCSWELLAKYHRQYSKKKEYLQDLIYMKKLWDDPSLEP